MSWISNYIFGEESDISAVPDSFDCTAVSGSWNQPTCNKNEPEEVVSGIRYRHNSVELDLNIPAVDPSVYDYGYGGEPPYVQSGYGDGGESVEPNIDNSRNYGGESVEPNIDNSRNYGGESVEPPLDGAECSYPIIVSFETDRVFNSRDELVEWVRKRGTDHGYVIIIKRTKENAIWFRCSLGGQYKSIATVRRTGSKKTGCPFELQGSFLSREKFWMLKVNNPMHNHTPIENLEGHAYTRRLSADEKRLVGELAEQDIPARSIWAALVKKNPEKKVKVFKIKRTNILFTLNS